MIRDLVRRSSMPAPGSAAKSRWWKLVPPVVTRWVRL